MPILYNVQSKKPELLDGPELQNALASGTHSYGAGEMINVTSPDGVQGTIPAEKANEAVLSGFKAQTPSEAAIEEYVASKRGIKGDLEVGLKQLANQALFSLPELIQNKTQDPFTIAKREALQKEHAPANFIGGAIGFGGSLFTGAPLFKVGTKAYEKTAALLAEKIIQSGAEEVGKRTALEAAKGILKNVAVEAGGRAAEGAVIASPHAITEAMLGDPEAAAESILAGAGIGSIFGVGTGLGKEMLGSLRKKVQSAVEATDAADNASGMRALFKGKAEDKAVEALNPTLSQVERLENSKDPKLLGRFLLDEGVITPMASRKQMYERLQTKTSEIGQEMGSILKTADDKILVNGETALLVKPAELAQKITEELQTKYGHLDAFKPALKNFESTIESMRANQGTWTLQEAAAQKKAWGDRISTWGLDKTDEKRFAESIYRGINNEIDSKIGLGLGQDELAKFKDLKQKYGYLQEAEKIAQKSSARETRNNDFGLTSYVLAGSGAIAGGAPGAALALLGREGSRRYGDQILAKAYDKMAGLLFAEKAMGKIADKLDIIPSALENLGKKIPASKSNAALSAVMRLMDGGDHKVASRDDRAKKLQEFSEKATKWVNNPEEAAKHIAEFTYGLSNGGAPGIAAVTQSKFHQALGYIFQEMPKPPRPTSPFSRQYAWKPSDQQMAAFEQKTAVVLDPFSVFDELQRGTLTKHHIDALRKVYPTIYKHMKSRMQDVILKGPKPVTFSQRAKLSMIMEAPMDIAFTPEKIMGYQQTYAGQTPEQQEEGLEADINVADDTASDVDKLMG